MKCAILGNGPSRIAYSPDEYYDFRIGCNIPYSRVDNTVIMDPDVVTVWSNNINLVTCPVWMTRSSYKHSNNLKFNGSRFRSYIEGNNLFLGLEHQGLHDSSGHVAARVAIRLGYKQLDLYGIDSWFEDNMDSYTRKHVVDNPPMSKISLWRGIWNEMMSIHPDVVFNFT